MTRLKESQLATKKCVPCEGGVCPIKVEDTKPYMTQIPEWRVVKGHEGKSDKLQRDYTFKNFKAPQSFARSIGNIAESEGHHPDIRHGWGYLTVETNTHAINGLSENDFVLAAKIEARFNSHYKQRQNEI